MLRRRTYSKEVDSGKYQVCYADSGFLVSSDYGRTWKEAGKYSYCMGEDYDLAMSADGRYRFCSANAAVTSSDYGNTWQEGSTLGTAKGAFMSSDGRYMATSVGAVLYMSSDYGRTWDKAYTFPTSLAGSNNRDALGMSADGRYMAVVLYQDHIHVSSDYGKTWKKTADTSGYRSSGSVKISRDGRYMAACMGQRGVCVSADYGATWKWTVASNMDWTAFAMSADGRYLVAKSSPEHGLLTTSSDYGNTWREISATWKCSNMEMSGDGRYLLGYFVQNYSGGVFLSSDYGNTWKEILVGKAKEVRDCAISRDGRYMTVVLGRYNEFYYITTDYGVTWEELSFGTRTGTYRITMNR